MMLAWLYGPETSLSIPAGSFRSHQWQSAALRYSVGKGSPFRAPGDHEASCQQQVQVALKGCGLCTSDQINQAIPWNRFYLCGLTSWFYVNMDYKSSFSLQVKLFFLSLSNRRQNLITGREGWKQIMEYYWMYLEWIAYNSTRTLTVGNH